MVWAIFKNSITNFEDNLASPHRPKKSGRPRAIKTIKFHFIDCHLFYIMEPTLEDVIFCKMAVQSFIILHYSLWWQFHRQELVPRRPRRADTKPDRRNHQLWVTNKRRDTYRSLIPSRELQLTDQRYRCGRRDAGRGCKIARTHCHRTWLQCFQLDSIESVGRLRHNRLLGRQMRECGRHVFPLAVPSCWRWRARVADPTA